MLAVSLENFISLFFYQKLVRMNSTDLYIEPQYIVFGVFLTRDYFN